MTQLFKDANNYNASYDQLRSQLFVEKPEGIRLIWESINMMVHDVGSDKFRLHYKAEFEGFKGLSEFHTNFRALPMHDEKALISLFRWFLSLSATMKRSMNWKFRKQKLRKVNNNNKQKKLQ